MGTAHMYPLEVMSGPWSALLIAQKGLQGDPAGTVLLERYKGFDLNGDVPHVFPGERMRAIEVAPQVFSHWAGRFLRSWVIPKECPHLFHAAPVTS